MQARVKFFLVFLAIHALVFGQIPNNSWRDHLAYNRAHSVAITPNKVFCAMSSGGMISYTKSSGEIEKMSKVTGLSDINVTALAYSAIHEALIIGYENGNIDLLTKSGIANIPDIKRKRLSSLKTINHIEVYGERVFLACAFGIVELDLAKVEIRDTYFFGEDGSSIFVSDVTINNQQIYAATENGIYIAPLNAANLVDYRFWQKVSTLDTETRVYKNVEAFNNTVYALYLNTSNSHVRMIQVNADESWEEMNIVSDTVLFQITAYNNLLSVATNKTTHFFNQNLNLTKSLDIIYGRYAVTDDDESVYIAAEYLGFFKVNDGSEPFNIAVDGPRFNTTGQIKTKGEHVWVGSGGPYNIYKDGAAHNFYNENWRTLSSGYTEGLQNVGNIYTYAFEPGNDNHVYASSYAHGIFEINNYEVVASHKWQDVPAFKQAIDSIYQVRAMGLDFDKNGALWTVMESTSQPVFVKRKGEDWEQLTNLSSDLLRNKDEKWRGVLVTKTNQIWLLNLQHGIVVLQEDSEGNIREKQFTIRNQDGDNLTQAYCMVEDNDGNVWVGTNKGPIVFSTSNNLFDDPDFHGNQIKLNRNDDSGLADYLLNYEKINDIAVDGGNRKWLATESSGLFLVSSDGEETLHQFTEDTPEMISNSVISVGVQEKTGEVFISTAEGLIAFMGRATEGGQTFSNVYVYPNPIRPEYNGDITISGLVENASVKITDISGNMVYDTRSLGGQAVWNGRNYNGDRVKTGVYLVFLTNEDGSSTQVTKLVFIH